MTEPWRVLALPPLPQAVLVDLFDPTSRADLDMDESALSDALSPHAAGSTAQAVQRILRSSNENLCRVLDGEPVVDVVNGQDPHVVRRRG